MEKTSLEDEKVEADDNAQTIRPTRSPQGPGVNISLPLVSPPAPEATPVIEDYSDLVIGEDDEKLQEKMADFKVRD